MNIHKLSFIVGFFMLFTKSTFSQSSPDNQAKLEKIIPISPTAASIAKFGNIPVNNFTGSPNVNIPLYQVGSGQLTVPVSLDYQFNGLRVEEIPSWVGLGWTLDAGGAISRTVRGIPDEEGDGYISIAGSNQMTTKFIIDSMLNPTYEDDIKFTLTQAGKSLYDLEPDIFYFKFPGGSGKFYYNQEEQKFYSLPAQNIKIDFDFSKFILTTADGNRYHFTANEYTTANSPTCTGSQAQAGNTTTTTSWYLSKIENNTQTDSITFEYADTYYTFDNLSTSTKYTLILSQGSATQTPPNFQNQLCYQTTTIAGKRLSYIRFRNGYLKFTPSDSARVDLPGDKSLKKIELFSDANQLLKRHTFDYGYFGTGTGIEQRLKLIAVNEVSNDSASTIPYKFTYEEGGTFPSRLSYAQDYWGYYNGATTNSSLIPAMLYTVSSTPQYSPGDDRKASFAYAKLGAIKTITYPTGGSTEFEFENNEVTDPYIQPERELHFVDIEGDHNGGIQTIYTDTFVVNEPPNFYNFNDPSGGVYADLFFEAIGCDLSGGASTCAILTVDGLTSGTTSWGPLTQPVTGRHLPNGTYVLKATFNQNPALFEDFYFKVSWNRAVMDSSYLVGGIRIKRLIDYDSLDPSKKIIRKFTYASDATGKSSGKVCGYPNSYVTDFENIYYTSDIEISACVLYSLTRTYKKQSSSSNYPLVAHQGGYVGYEQVNVFSGENGENGKTVYKYQYYPDDISGFPAVATSKEWLRGVPLKESTFKKTASSFSLLQEDTTSYKDLTDYDVDLAKVSYGLKPTFTTSVVIEEDLPCGSLEWLQTENESLIPSVADYQTVTGNLVTAYSKSTIFETSGQLETIRLSDYNAKNYLPKETKSVNSIGDTIITRIKYNVDYTLVSSSPTWLNQLSVKKVHVPIEKITLVKRSNGTLYVTGGTLTYFKNGKPLPDKIYTLNISSPLAFGSFTESTVDGSGNFVLDSHYKEAASINSYDVYNNVVEQQNTRNVKNSYIWDYKNAYPVAEVTNADSTSVAFTSFEADGKGGWSFSGSNSTDATSPTGKKCYLLSGGNITKSGLSSTTYIVSYWGKSGSVSVNSTSPTKTGKTIGNWTYYEHEISTTSITISGSNYIDELRLYPKGSMMATFTYNPLIGVTSECDASNKIIYYDYDTFNHLKVIKDEDGNILKRVDYKYNVNTLQ